MANKEQLEILKKGVKTWNKWREENPDVKIDLTYIAILNEDMEDTLQFFMDTPLDIDTIYSHKLTIPGDTRGINLANADLSDSLIHGLDLRNSNFCIANLCKSKLLDVNFSSSNLQGIKFIQSKLYIVKFNHSNLDLACFEDATLSDIDFLSASMIHTDVCIAKFSKVKINKSQLINLERGPHEHQLNNLTIIEDRSDIKSHKDKLDIIDENVKLAHPSSPSLASLERSLRSDMETLSRGFDHKVEELKDSYNSKAIPNDIKKELLNQAKELTSDALLERIGNDVHKSTADYTLKKYTKDIIIKDGYVKAALKNAYFSEESEKQAKAFRTIGFVFAFSGAGLAALIFLTAYFKSIGWIETDNLNNIYQYLTLSFPIILCETLAFVMFAYGAKAHEKMRHFATEAATLDLQAAGARTVVTYGTPEEIITLGKNLAKTERNFILKTGEHTIETANNKITIEMLEKMSALTLPTPPKDDKKTST